MSIKCPHCPQTEANVWLMRAHLVVKHRYTKQAADRWLPPIAGAYDDIMDMLKGFGK